MVRSEPIRDALEVLESTSQQLDLMLSGTGEIEIRYLADFCRATRGFLGEAFRNVGVLRSPDMIEISKGLNRIQPIFDKAKTETRFPQRLLANQYRRNVDRRILALRQIIQSYDSTLGSKRFSQSLSNSSQGWQTEVFVISATTLAFRELQDLWLPEIRCEKGPFPESIPEHQRTLDHVIFLLDSVERVSPRSSRIRSIAIELKGLKKSVREGLLTVLLAPKPSAVDSKVSKLANATTPILSRFENVLSDVVNSYPDVSVDGPVPLDEARWIDTMLCNGDRGGFYCSEEVAGDLCEIFEQEGLFSNKGFRTRLHSAFDRELDREEFESQLLESSIPIVQKFIGSEFDKALSFEALRSNASNVHSISLNGRFVDDFSSRLSVGLGLSEHISSNILELLAVQLLNLLGFSQLHYWWGELAKSSEKVVMQVDSAVIEEYSASLLAGFADPGGPS